MHAIRAKIGNCDSKKQSPPAAPLHGTSGSRSLNRINATAFSPGVYRGHHDWRSTFVGPSRAQQDHRLVKAQSAPRGGADPGSMDDSSGSSTQLPAAFSPESAGLDSRKVLTRAEAREVYDANGRKVGGASPRLSIPRDARHPQPRRAAAGGRPLLQRPRFALRSQCNCGWSGAAFATGFLLQLVAVPLPSTCIRSRYRFPQTDCLYRIL